MSKKPASIFDFMSALTDKKGDWESWTETDRKRFAPYITNRWFSMRMELTGLINDLQKYTIGILKPEHVYKLYHGILPQQKLYAKYIKGSTEDKYNANLIAVISKHFLVSKTEALDYVKLLGKDKCFEILSKYGYSEKEKKTMLKGLK